MLKRRKSKVPIKWVVVERTFRGRYVALRGLSFASEDDAKAHIVAKINPKAHHRYSVESREVKPDDDSLRMTCQCCGRKILANLGSIALHGYQRPDYGWQTASCGGAKELPFEVDRKALGRLIVALQDLERRMQAAREACASEFTPIVREWKRGQHGNKQTFRFEFTRENFEWPMAHKALNDSGRYDRSFDDLLKVELANHDSGLRSIAKDIEMQQARYDRWKQTHEWRDNQWAALRGT
jgi:hypothetical protein